MSTIAISSLLPPRPSGLSISTAAPAFSHTIAPLLRFESTGTTFTHWIADHNVLWSSPLTPAALEQSIRYYGMLAGGTAALGWVYLGVLLVAFIAAAGKLCSDWGKGGEVLFDGASVCEYWSGRVEPVACGRLWAERENVRAAWPSVWNVARRPGAHS